MVVTALCIAAAMNACAFAQTDTLPADKTPSPDSQRPAATKDATTSDPFADVAPATASQDAAQDPQST